MQVRVRPRVRPRVRVRMRVRVRVGFRKKDSSSRVLCRDFKKASKMTSEKLLPAALDEAFKNAWSGIWNDSLSRALEKDQKNALDTHPELLIGLLKVSVKILFL